MIVTRFACAFSLFFETLRIRLETLVYDKPSAGLSFDNEISDSTAYSGAMSLLWLDILITCAILTAIASRL